MPDPPESAPALVPEVVDEPKPGLLEPLGRMGEAAKLVASGMFKNQEVAQIVGIHPSTLSRWLARPEFVAACSEFRREFSAQGVRDSIIGRAGWLVAMAEELARNSEDDQVRLRAILALLDHAIGKPAQHIEHSQAPARPIEKLEELERRLADARARLAQAKSGALGGARVEPNPADEPAE